MERCLTMQKTHKSYCGALNASTHMQSPECSATDIVLLLGAGNRPSVSHPWEATHGAHRAGQRWKSCLLVLFNELQ